VIAAVTPPLPPGDRCPVAAEAPPVPAPGLERSRAALARGGPLVVVALGSSSTLGVGASSPAAAYPARLEAFLEAVRPGAEVAVLNRGVGLETSEGALARLGDVLAAGPGLVVWQAGTNDALRGVPLDRLRAALARGVAEIRAAGAEAILMGPQFYPGEGDVPGYGDYVAAVREVARGLDVAYLDRHAVVRGWIQDGRVAPAAVIAADGLHPNDAGYRCLAELVAGTILGGAADGRPPAPAPAPAPAAR
jgi:lysophospholipase L1-like esterase